ncbi:predicted protein [Naegleria gruberi]|uniref:Predicted protein n=1 Tax=Naegleria gruberi TaxID=5762 RepID=D2VI35_NAEGR|nr:uncharacterized protein NAEGRDRAFT_68546 [Naegleria gruberi]EFC43446.1 predicted protein [Naegleria gruberi]|eukprot:XP_002676190.1 predicted protein [Naegleria gruberi strain NEG-M]
MGQGSSQSTPRLEDILTSPSQWFYFRDYQAHATCSEKIRLYKELNKLVDLRSGVDGDEEFHDDGSDAHKTYHNKSVNNLSSEEKRKSNQKYEQLKDLMLENACVMCQTFSGRIEEVENENKLRECFGDELVDWSQMKKRNNEEKFNEEEQLLSLPILPLDYDRLLYCFQSNNATIPMFDALAKHKSFLTQRGSLRELFPHITNNLREQRPIAELFSIKNTPEHNFSLLKDLSNKQASKEFQVLDSCINKSEAQVNPNSTSCLGEALIYSHAVTPKFCQRQIRDCLERKIPSFVVNGLDDDEAWEHLSVIDYTQCLLNRSKSMTLNEAHECFDNVMDFMGEQILKE